MKTPVGAGCARRSRGRTVGRKSVLRGKRRHVAGCRSAPSAARNSGFPRSIRFRSIFCAIPIPRTKRCARRANRMARKVWRLRRGAACRGEADPQRSGDLLLRPGRGFERLSAREAVAASEPGAGARSARARSRSRRAQSRVVGDRDAVASRAFRRGGAKSLRRRLRERAVSTRSPIAPKSIR